MAANVSSLVKYDNAILVSTKDASKVGTRVHIRYFQT